LDGRAFMDNSNKKPILRWTVGAILTFAGIILLIPGITVFIGWGIAVLFPMAFDVLLYDIFKWWAQVMGYAVSKSSSDIFFSQLPFLVTAAIVSGIVGYISFTFGQKLSQ
jgi:hypothetical protein